MQNITFGTAMAGIEKVKILARSSNLPVEKSSRIKRLRKGYYRKLNVQVPGEAPKDFIKVYEYSEGVFRFKPKTWPSYIAKVGHKWYPTESLTEYLLNRIGEVLGFKMSESKLMLVKGQVRFLSKYFLKNTSEVLVHGADIFAGYLGDKDFTEEVEKKDMARELFTFQFAEEAINAMFPEHGEAILGDFIEMLLFDAIVGNNDRHFYNWAVITHLRKKKTPTFAPIYDTARGLFWNTADDKLTPYKEARKLNKYAEGSQPKTGWEGVEDINHFELIGKIFHEDRRYKDVCSSFLNEDKIRDVYKMIDSEFSGLLSLERLHLIKDCLSYRFEKIASIIKE